MTEFPAQLAIEYFKASGAKTRERLNDLVEHFATSYGRLKELETLQEQAAKAIPAYMWE